MQLLWLNSILGLIFIFFCFILIIILYPKTGLTQKQKKIKFKPRVTIEPQHSSVALVIDLVVQVVLIFVT